ncbi:MAG: hypothetical protein IJ265_09265 [Oscillospiraceae bacterium]|nr:hypothetical protein [Oscillospiraceae bacterium]
MLVLEIIGICLSLVLGIYCTCSDLQNGIIRNKVLGIFAVIGMILDIAYYGIFAQDLFADFLFNFLTVTIVCLFLFFSHSFAGGDCKMAIVLSLLYPARMYYTYNQSNITLLFAIGLAILTGYLYLLIDASRAIVTRKTSVTRSYIKSSLLSFFSSYLPAMAYIAFFNSVFLLFDLHGITPNVWISRSVCLLVAWCTGRFPIFKKLFLILPAIMVTLIISFLAGVLPLSVHFENYLLVFILLFCQLIIKTTIYETISMDQLKKGMILSSFSSILMQSSITKGLPGISTEDLKSRLSDDEVQSIKRWAKDTHTDKLTIVRKIPFAVFIAIGFAVYFLLWSITA